MGLPQFKICLLNKIIRSIIKKKKKKQDETQNFLYFPLAGKAPTELA